MVKRDYYEVLGLPRDADEETIKRAFHSLARDCHPDVAEAPDAEVRFRELAEAYAVLSKRDARLLYDRYGYRGAGNQGFDETLWEGRPRTTRGENVHLNLELLSFEAAEGSRRVVSYDAAVRCQDCAGRGSLRLLDPDCELCHGTGQRRQALQLYFSDLLQIQECTECLGRPCASCGGHGTVLGERRIRRACRTARSCGLAARATTPEPGRSRAISSCKCVCSSRRGIPASSATPRSSCW